MWDCHNRNRDGMTNQKIKFVKRDFGVATIVIIGNYGKPKKGARSTKKEIGGTGLITRRESVSTLQRPS